MKTFENPSRRDARLPSVRPCAREGPGRHEPRQDFASIAESVGGDRVETFALAKGYQDPHFVDAKPSFILKLSRADLLIVAGLELEIGYLPPLIDQSRNDTIHPGIAGLPRRLRRLRHPAAPDDAGDAGHGRRPPVRQPALLDRPGERARDRARHRRQARGARSGRRRVLCREPGGVRGQADREGERVGGEDGASCREQDRHVPRLVAELRQALQARDRRATSSRSPESRRRPPTPSRSST